MKLKYLAFAILIQQLSCKSHKEKKEFLPQEAISEFKTINPDTNYIADLSFLDKIVGGKKIILLGEKGHDFGSDFLLKTKIIKYLSGKFGFKTIAFEGGSFYTINNPDKPILSDPDFETNFPIMSMFAVWGYSSEFKPLARYIKTSGLKIVGLENQLGISGNYQFLYDLKNYLNKNKVAYDTSVFKTFESSYVTILSEENSQRKNTIESLPKLKIWLMDIKKELVNNKTPSCNFYSAVIDNIIDAFDFYAISDPGNFDAIAKCNNIRDKRMFSNLEWYINSHPSEKLIVWTASFHACKDLGLIEHDKDSLAYQNTTVIGEYIFNKYGSSSSAFAIVSGGGKVGFVMDTIETLVAPPAKDTPLEFYISSNYKTPVFVDFNKVEDRSQKFKSGFFTLQNGKWFSSFDGVFYVPVARRATMLKME